MARTNSFKLLGQAFKSARRPMWASIQVLIVLTVILATIFFLAEYRAQPEEYNYGRSLLWAFTRYIGDPGKFAGPGPITLTGRLIASLIGIVGILIFAVPAGLVGSGFRNAIDAEIRKKHLADIGDRLVKAFRREFDYKTKFRYVPRNISICTLQAKKHMTEKDVIDAVVYNPPFRLRNLATAETRGNKSNDKLVIEMFPYNRVYGALINRRSNITIACPSSADEAGIGNLGYYLALFGGFNFISKEIEPLVDEMCSYYNIEEETAPEPRAMFLEDLKKLSKGKDSWVFILVISDRPCVEKVHFVTKAFPKTGRDSIVINQEAVQQIFEKTSDVLSDEYYDIKCEMNKEYKPVGSNNVGVRIGAGLSCNAVVIRISTDFVTWDHRYISFCKDMAEIINDTVGDPSKATPLEKIKEKGYGYLSIEEINTIK